MGPGDPTDEPADAGADAPIVFVSDASAEAERLTLALRARGYVAVDVPLALLASRVAVQRPALVVCDADAEGALEVIRRLRDLGDSPVPLALTGHAHGALDRTDAGLAAATFLRPTDPLEIASAIERIVGPGRRGRLSSRPSTRGTGVATSSRPPGLRSSPVAAPSRPPQDAAPPVPTLPPDLAAEAEPPREQAEAPLVELSHEVLQVLREAEDRLDSSRPSPSNSEDMEPGLDVEAALPPDALVALSEPLDDEDVLDDSRTPGPAQDGTAALTGTRAGPRGQTNVGAAGTHATVLGALDGSGAFASEAPPAMAPGAGAPADADTSDDARRTKQQAATPRAPKPAGGEEPVRGTIVEPVARGSMAPGTGIDIAVPPEPVVTSLHQDVPTPPPSFAPHGLTPGQTSVGFAPPGFAEPGSRPRSSTLPPPSAPDPREQPSTTPPARVRDPARASEPPVVKAPAPEASVAAKVPPKSPELVVPAAIRAGDALATLAQAIRTRYTGALAFEVDEGIRRVVMRDGDFVIVASGVHGESLVAFLSNRGDLPPEVARQGHKLPAFGRRAGAALIANGHLTQDQLWPVLRAHAEWLVGRVLGIERGSASKEEVGRLADEPAVFGGATGAEVLVEVVRRIIAPEDALQRLGGPDTVLGTGPSRALLGECALSQLESERVQRAEGSTLRELLDGWPDPSIASATFALVALGVLAAEGVRRPAAPAAPVRDEIDEEALRERILSRKALVEEGDYFAVLGVPRDATGYDVRRAYTALRRELDPSRALTPGTTDLADTVADILAVLDEAYQLLSDQRRRDRYRRAIEATP